MHIVESRKIRSFVGKTSLPEIMPNFSPRALIQAVHPFCCAFMKFGEHRSDAGRITGRMPYKVIVIRKNRPSLQSPIKLTGHRQQSPVQDLKPIPTHKVMQFAISARSHHIGSALTESVARCMWPIWLSHRQQLRKANAHGKRILGVRWQSAAATPLWFHRETCPRLFQSVSSRGPGVSLGSSRQDLPRNSCVPSLIQSGVALALPTALHAGTLECVDTALEAKASIVLPGFYPIKRMACRPGWRARFMVRAGGFSRRGCWRGIGSRRCVSFGSRGLHPWPSDTSRCHPFRGAP